MRRFNVLLVRGTLFLRARMGVDSARAAVKAGVNVVHNHCPVVGVMNHGRVYVHHSRVVGEVSTLPASALEADSAISKPIINPAVEADMWAPVAAVPAVAATRPAPVTRRPQKAEAWCHHPYPRHPEIPRITVTPIPRRPKVTIARANGLLVNRNRRRSNVDRNAYSNLRRSRR